jgi:1,4-alpha-glucan branching enzyme
MPRASWCSGVAAPEIGIVFTRVIMKSTSHHISLGSGLPLLPAARPGKIEIVYRQNGAEEVFIAGDFNQWNPRSTPLRKDTNGDWRASLLLRPGPHEYRLVVDGEWRNDPRAVRSVANPFGSLNSVVQVM